MTRSLYVAGGQQDHWKSDEPWRGGLTSWTRSVGILAAFLALSIFWPCFAQTIIPPPPRSGIAPEDAVARVFQRFAPSVVSLITSKNNKPYARASGIVLTDDGYIATNYHALRGADSVEIRFFPQPADDAYFMSSANAALIYEDSVRDIAILKVKNKPSQHLEFPVRSGDLRPGEHVIAIGSPRGLSNTVSDGIVSATRNLDGQDAIQHTAPISPGSSGGALLDWSGALIGMNSWTLSDSQNLNFAIPARYLVASLAAAKKSQTNLAFPPAEDDDSESAFQSFLHSEAGDSVNRATGAFAAADYIQAANQSERAIANGQSDANIYTILGASQYMLGKPELAETYLRQALRLAQTDEAMTQTARACLLSVQRLQFDAHPGSFDRLGYVTLAKQYLESPAVTLFDQRFDAELRNWVSTIPAAVESIEGDWFDQERSNYIYRIKKDATGTLGITLAYNLSSAVRLIVFGTLTKDGDNSYEGTLTSYGLAQSGSEYGGSRQVVTVALRLSPDMMKLEGTGSYGKIDQGGQLSDIPAKLLSVTPGKRSLILQRQP